MPPGRSEPDALFGFTLPDLPASNTANAAKQLSLINGLWNSQGIILELRYIKTYDLQTTINVLCRIRRPQHIDRRGLQNFCLTSAAHIAQLFKDCGYHLQPITSEAVLTQALMPFQVQALAEIRRYEDIEKFVDAFTRYEFYVPYSWEWMVNKHLEAFTALQQLRSPALVGISLEPTTLFPHEQVRLSRVTSGEIRDMLIESGASGEEIYRQYQTYAQKLQRPYLSRICLAGPDQQALTHLGQSILAQTHFSGNMPELQCPRWGTEDWPAAIRSLSSLEWVPWGNKSEDTPEAMRFRYLVDSQGASMSFRLPVIPERKAQQIEVLIIFANPYYDIEGKQLNLAFNSRVIQQAIQLSPHRDNITITMHHATTIDDIRRALLQKNFQIVHFAGHGHKGGDGVQRLVLNDEQGNPYYPPPQALADLFAAYEKTLKCVVLNACDLLIQGQRIAQTIPCVIAMEGELSDNAAIEFSKGFYDALGAGKSTEFAYHEGCRCVNFITTDKKFMPRIFLKSGTRP
jgi:hypothetical protein